LDGQGLFGTHADCGFDARAELLTRLLNEDDEIVGVVDFENARGIGHAESVALALQAVDDDFHEGQFLPGFDVAVPADERISADSSNCLFVPCCDNCSSGLYCDPMPFSDALAVDAIDLSDLEFWARPLAEREAAFHRLRTERPLPFFAEPDPGSELIPVGPGYYAVTKYEDILEISKNAEQFCSGQGATSISDMPEFMLDFFGSMINMDDPRHARLRKIVSAAFTPKMLRQLEDQVAIAAKEIVDDILAKGGGDFVVDVAARLPLKVICDMMGIPESQYEIVFSRSNIILGAADEEYVPQGDTNAIITSLLTAGGDLHTLVSDLGAARRENPTDDLTSALVNTEVDGERLSDNELGSFFILLVVAGNETTRNAIAHGLHLFTDNPDEKAYVLEDLDGRMPAAVEEIVRVAAPVVWMRRTATRAGSLRGVDYAEGSKFILYYWSANRDEDVFTDPYTFNVKRSPNPHLGFGGPGPHFCLGAHLARREVSVMWKELLTRCPNIKATGEPDRLLSSFINGIKHLPFTV
jgi:methyl-branched lipid omega-hydroxylase